MANIHKKFRTELQKAFDLPSNAFIPMQFQSGQVLVYKNANLSLMLTDACNADCNFCVAHLRYDHLGKAYKKPSLGKLDSYLNRVTGVLNQLKALNPSVSLTGGEPTLYKAFAPILQTLTPLNLRKKTLTTNGTGVLRHTQALEAYGLHYLNVSRCHMNEAENQRIMQFKTEPANDSQLVEIVKWAQQLKLPVRLSCVLLQEGIHALKQIKEYLAWANSLGITQVIFRQLMHFNEQQAKGRIPLYCSDQTVQLPSLWQEMDKDTSFQLVHQVLGYYYYVEVRTYKGITVVTEMADLNQIKPQLQRFSDKFNGQVAFELVLHPNGNLCYGWEENSLVLDKYHA